jgi:transposase
MEYGAIDLHKKDSQIRIITEAGEVIDRRIATGRESFTRLFGDRAPMRILVEASTESEWVAQYLEGWGHQVIVADPNYAAMYGTLSRRIKTDQRDVTALADACVRGTYRAIHRRSAGRRAWQVDLTVRDGLVQMRTRVISMVRALTRAEGLRIPSGKTETFLQRLTRVSPSQDLAVSLAPLRLVLELLNEEIEAADRRMAATAASDPAVEHLRTFPTIGTLTATAFVTALDDVARFRRASQVSSYLGLVPREYSSGERSRRGRILRSAQPRVQRLLIQAAWRVWRSKRPDTAALRLWVERVAQRRGRRVAVVALARRIGRMLFAMWRDGRGYDAARIRMPHHTDRPATSPVVTM